MARFSQLEPLTFKEKQTLAMSACHFFNFGNNENFRRELSLTVEHGRIIPLSVRNFFDWYKKEHGQDLFPKQQRVKELFYQLADKGLLSIDNSFGWQWFDHTYYFMKELTTIEKKGALFLGKYLGIDFIAHKVKKNLARITGKTKEEDETVGTGILVTDSLILTCSHVVNDMEIMDENIEINGEQYKVKNMEYHPTVDFAVIVLESPVASYFCKDIALRNSQLLEKIVIAGFPKIPRKIDGEPIFQTGEIAGNTIESYSERGRIKLELFTAVARPGNSGGPLLSSDGKLLGLVTHTLEDSEINQQAEEIKKLYQNEQNENELHNKLIDNLTKRHTYPCFASVPASVIYESYQELEVSKQHILPWEDFQ